ncbi:hypothetical protein D0Y65_031779 [Glycine soja]|uniref:Uncharacterized protein n=1 Tax=Glycine soja TaxID=3848 RepID=A0A445I9X5_GLYSO|nr:hypothetical protein D0Y65_031779 [Glycine soja]
MIQNEEPLVRFLVLFADRRRALLLAGKHMALSFSLLLFSPAFLTELSSFAYCEQLWDYTGYVESNALRMKLMVDSNFGNRSFIVRKPLKYI